MISKCIKVLALVITLNYNVKKICFVCYIVSFNTCLIYLHADDKTV